MKDHDRKKKRSRQEFWRAVRFLWPYRVEVVIAVIGAFVSGLIFTIGLSAMLPIITVLLDNQEGGENRTLAQMYHEQGLLAAAKGKSTWYYDHAEGIAHYLPDKPVHTIALVFVLILCLAMVGNVFRFLHEYLSDKSAISAINDIRKKLYDHILHLPIPYFGRHGTSDVTSRLVQDSMALQDGFKTVLGPAIAEPIKAGFALLLAAIIDWRLTLFIIVFAPLMAAVIKKFGKKVRRASRAALQGSSNMLGQIEGTLTGIRVVKSATAERFERRHYSAIMHELHKDQLKMARYEAFSTPTLETLGMVAVGIVLILASYAIFEQHSLSRAGFLLILASLVSIGESLRRVSKLNNVLQKSNAAAARLFELIDEPIERPKQLPAGEKLVRMRGLNTAITFENLSFSYPGTSHLALDNVNLTVNRGQSVAIVGRNGSGKTTLLSLLPRFFEPNGGNILIDGVDVRRLTLKSLRQHIAIVTQDAVVFPGTIAENIAYGHPSAPLLTTAPDSAPAKALREQIEAAAKEAFAHEFVLQKPQGYDTRLEGLGSQLSGGQKQRLNIARAILRNAPILVLDEATSQVDAESEHLIQNAIERLMSERTTFVIAHRFSTIKAADAIVVMEAGRIVGQGKHDELMRDCPTYSGLYERQIMPE
ncbi:MAG: ABC transporter ATP-binding protein [Tepidisphaeraceae bacterium]